MYQKAPSISGDSGRPISRPGGSDRIRVLHLIKSLGRGGAEVLLPEGLRFSDEDRFEYRVAYFIPWKDAMVPALEEMRIDVECFGGRNNAQILLAARRLASKLRGDGIDLMHCHLPIAGVVGRIAGRLAGVPVVYTEHNLQERYHPATRLLNRSTWRLQERVIAVSHDVRDSIIRNIGDRVPIQVVLNGVNVESFRREPFEGDAAREALGIPRGAPVVGSVAVFRAQKNLGDWVEAARLILEGKPETHFLLVGDGPLRPDVVSAIERAGLAERVHLPGLKEDVRPYLAMMDIYMMSSVFEGLPVALLEAMSMECAPVCTAVGGIPEVIQDGTNGILVPPRQPRELSAAALRLLGDDALRAAYRRAAREAIVRRFSMARMTGEIESLYLQVLDGRRAAG